MPTFCLPQELDVLAQADSLLKKLGVKTPGLTIKPPHKGQPLNDNEDEDVADVQQQSVQKSEA